MYYKGAAFLKQKEHSFSVSSMSLKKVTVLSEKHVSFQRGGQYSVCWRTVHASSKHFISSVNDYVPETEYMLTFRKDTVPRRKLKFARFSAKRQRVFFK